MDFPFKKANITDFPSKKAEQDYTEEIRLYSQILTILHVKDPLKFNLRTYTVTKEGRDQAFEHLKEAVPKLQDILREQSTITYSPDFINKLKEENRKLKEDFPEFEVVTCLYEELSKKDELIYELTTSIKELNYQFEKRIRELEHTMDLVDCSTNRISKIEQENKFLKQLLKDHEEMLRTGKAYETVFTKEVMDQLNETD